MNKHSKTVGIAVDMRTAQALKNASNSVAELASAVLLSSDGATSKGSRRR